MATSAAFQIAPQIAGETGDQEPPRPRNSAGTGRATGTMQPLSGPERTPRVGMSKSYEPGEVVLGGKFQITRLVDRGGMGALYDAVQLTVGRRVALKILDAAMDGHSDAVKRFRKEAMALGALDHRNIVTVHDAG